MEGQVVTSFENLPAFCPSVLGPAGPLILVLIAGENGYTGHVDEKDLAMLSSRERSVLDISWHIIVDDTGLQ